MAETTILDDRQRQVLDVGCGRNKVPGALGLDRRPVPGVDVIHDLELYPYPFANNTFKTIYARHVIEHLKEPIAFMAELHRILAPGGLLHLHTPHYSYMGSWRDPTHLHHFSIYTMEYFSEDHPADYYTGQNRWEIQCLEIRMLRLWKCLGWQALINASGRFPGLRFIRKNWEEYLSFLIRAKEIRAVLKALKGER